MSEINRKIATLSEEVYSTLVLLRHYIHENPELGNEEYKTSALIAQTLKNWKIAVEKVPNSTAVIGYIKGNLSNQNSIGIRADIDALPLQETSGVEFSSKIPGVMHACGHDVNAVNLLGTAYVLSNLKEHFGGTIKLIFQPAEEIFGGAQELLDYGVLENPKVSAILAAHVNARYPVGKIAIKAGAINMAASFFEITLQGRGGHASAPHATEDIVLAAAKIIIELQTIPGHKTNHIEPAIVTVASIHGGNNGNIIPNELKLMGTVRAQEYIVHKMIENQINQILKAQELITGVKGILDFQFAVHAVYNDPELTHAFIEEISDLIGKDNVIIESKPTNGSENFALFSEKVPSVYFRIGGIKSDDNATVLAHNSNFKVEDESIKTGVAVMVKAAIKFVQK